MLALQWDWVLLVWFGGFGCVLSAEMKFSSLLVQPSAACLVLSAVWLAYGKSELKCR